MRSSIRVRYTLIMAAVIFAVIGCVLLFNTFYLEKYVAREKQDDIRETVKLIEAHIEGGLVWESETELALSRKTSAKNIGVAICSIEGFAPILRYSNGYNPENYSKRFISYISGDAIVPDEILESGKNYTMYRIFDARLGSDQIECLGSRGNVRYIISASMEGIRESVVVTNRFLLYLGFGGIILGGIMCYFVSRRLTRPILELASISEQMAGLNFDVRYQGDARNEIGVLGDSMNHMSERLHSTITALQSANEQLEKDIREKERIDEARREFLSNVSHELKTPIALIQGYSEGLKEGIAEDPESRDYYCEVIIDEASRMNHLVKQLLNLGEIESGALKPSMETFDLTEVLRGVIQASMMLYKDRNCHVHFYGEEGLCVHADEFMIEEVLQNFLSNAGNHVNDGGQITVRAGRIRPGWIRVAVHNTGAEIPEEDMDHIWEKFYKTDKARTRSYGGSGIGLSIVKTILESHGGICGVQNKDGGVEFWFELEEKRN